MKEHHPCKQPACLDQIFVVFDTKMTLVAHMVEVHGVGMSSSDIRRVRGLETGSECEDRGGNRRRGGSGNRGRGREPHLNGNLQTYVDESSVQG